MLLITFRTLLSCILQKVIKKFCFISKLQPAYYLSFLQFSPLIIEFSKPTKVVIERLVPFCRIKEVPFSRDLGGCCFCSSVWFLRLCPPPSSLPPLMIAWRPLLDFSGKNVVGVKGFFFAVCWREGVVPDVMCFKMALGRGRLRFLSDSLILILTTFAMEAASIASGDVFSVKRYVWSLLHFS